MHCTVTSWQNSWWTLSVWFDQTLFVRGRVGGWNSNILSGGKSFFPDLWLVKSNNQSLNVIIIKISRTFPWGKVFDISLQIHYYYYWGTNLLYKSNKSHIKILQNSVNWKVTDSGNVCYRQYLTRGYDKLSEHKKSYTDTSYRKMTRSCLKLKTSSFIQCKM